MAEADMWEPLVITEDGDTTGAVSESCNTNNEQQGEHITVSKLCSESQSQEMLQRNAEADVKDEAQNKQDELQKDQHGKKAPEETSRSEPSTQEEDVHSKPPQDPDPVEEAPGGSEKDPKKAHRLTPDFPDALYELLCTLQEGRRLNDQRCSFTTDTAMMRRRCHSEPNTIKPSHRVVFSSMSSLQKEEFFDQVATAQARRLNDQRAKLERSPPPKPKGRSFRGSIKQLSFVKKPEPAPVPKEELYSMLLHTQAQGRLEDQRSRAPGPMDDEVFFSLLLRVQGGRMDEQRTELPRMVHT